MLAADLGATVIAVEPDPVNVDRLKGNLALNDISAEIWPLALTSDSGTVFIITDDMDSENHLLSSSGEGRPVSGERFDSLIHGRHVQRT